MIPNLYLITAILATATLFAYSEPTVGEISSQDLPVLSVGNKAPAIAVSSWLRGNPVTDFEQGHIYVMEFWASWCVPCVAGMPHLSKLQTTFAEDVTIIGINIWEDPAVASEWVTNTGMDFMDYTVAIQDGTEMESTWMKPAGQQGIPAAFVINRSGLIAWIGHPLDLDEPLLKIIQDDWDIEAARIAFQSGAQIERRKTAEITQFELMAKAEIDAHMAAKKTQDLDAFAETSSALIDLHPPPDIAKNLFGVGIHRMLTGQRASLAVGFIWKNKHVIRDDKLSLVMYGKAIIHDELFLEARDADLAIDLLARACEIDKHEDSDLLSLLAKAHILKAKQIQKISVKNAQQGKKKSKQLLKLDAYENALLLSQ